MFRAVLQSNNKVLRGLICSLLHLAESEVSAVEITNPIVLGETVKDKEFRLDINMIMNNFLDYTLFDEYPEFYASYKLINVKNHQKYSDNLTMYVIDLSRIDLATEEDKKYHIHEWAYLFKAATWEELKMIASRDEYLKEASQTIFRMSADEEIRKRCRDREEYYQDLRNYRNSLAERDTKIQQLQEELEMLKKQSK